MILGCLILRFPLVPLGVCVATMVAALVVCFAHWAEFARMIAEDSQAPENIVLAVFFMGPAVALIMSVAAIAILMPGILGVLISEAFAIRSWMFHAVNGALSSWVGWVTMQDFLKPYEFYHEPTIVIGAGIAAGFSYWAIAGWTAGFWKPVFSPPPSSPPSAAPA